MAKFVKGHSKIGGKEKGTPNKTTRELKEIINEIVSGQVPNINPALNEILTKDPDKYLNLLLRLMEFVVAKKKDITSDDQPMQQAVNIHVTDPKIGEQLKKMLE